MASRNAYIRYRIINSILKEYGSATLEQLMDACERALDIYPVGRRTIEGDIADMRHDDRLGFNAPIIYDRQLRAYRYEDEDYSIDALPLNTEELQNLKFAAAILKQYRQISYLEQFQGTVQKIVDAINVYRMQEEEAEFDFIEFENAPLIRGTEHLEPLVNHIRYKNVIRVWHQSFDADKPGEYVLHPYLLKEYRNRWYLVARDEAVDMCKIFGLERIREIRKAPVIPFREKQEDLENYFRNNIGISGPDREPVEIEAAFTEKQARYLATQPLHDTQMYIGEFNGRLHFKFNVVPNFEFTSMLMGWGNEVEVLSPKWYREEIKYRLQETLDNYTGNAV